MFQSNFECFINETCFQTLNNLIYPTSKYPFNATLIQLNNSRYNATTSVEYIVENLMIEEWNNQTSFESYFEQCNPFLCTYTYNLRGDISYVFATIIGLIGGLITIFQLIIPFIVTVIRRWRQNRRTNVTLSMIDESKRNFAVLFSALC